MSHLRVSDSSHSIACSPVCLLRFLSSTFVLALRREFRFISLTSNFGLPRVHIQWAISSVPFVRSTEIHNCLNTSLSSRKSGWSSEGRLLHFLHEVIGNLSNRRNATVARPGSNLKCECGFVLYAGDGSSLRCENRRAYTLPRFWERCLLFFASLVALIPLAKLFFLGVNRH